ncbi:ParB N-terminal domain-containing protein [Vibrio caribbeanicus]|uniref:ParB-like N-terminal domain-containing protein n=1 Tax=Vibrio caribbeanicus ATCC BAA-2122 TaxID=796620 RepID=E3BG42_9VIBR|nr:ParB N-terminal domain-containing protein [Vibrio caribbeanicus]EFP97967.1 hypothetical protein VIBC2010_06269 [Vibrio caribbeanicus ATCC BAA-2122]
MKGVSLQMLALSELKPHEYTDDCRVKYVMDEISRSKLWKAPVVVDYSTKIIMDGHHRVQAANIIGLKSIPCYMTNYSDKNIKVCCWKTGNKFDKSQIYLAASSGYLLPIKTTRHVIDYELKELSLDIELLKSDIDKKNFYELSNQ